MSTTETLTDTMIATLRSEAAAAGELTTVALCDVALATELDRIADVGDQISALEELGVVPSHVDADVRARDVLAEMITDALTDTITQET